MRCDLRLLTAALVGVGLSGMNEFGYANYEIVPTPAFLGTEVKGEIPR
jgi:hypothetical protein